MGAPPQEERRGVRHRRARPVPAPRFPFVKSAQCKQKDERGAKPARSQAFRIFQRINASTGCRAERTVARLKGAFCQMDRLSVLSGGITGMYGSQANNGGTLFDF